MLLIDKNNGRLASEMSNLVFTTYWYLFMCGITVPGAVPGAVLDHILYGIMPGT